MPENSAETMVDHLPGRVYAQTIALCLLATLFTAGLFAVYKDADFWAGLRPAQAFEFPGASERLFVESIFRTRANTWSNLAYVYVGLFAIAASLHDRRHRARGNYLLETPFAGIFFGLSCIYLGIGSGIFHASLTHWGQQLDVAAMYSTLVALIAINLGRHWRLAPGGMPLWPVWTSIAVVVDILLYVYKWSMSSSIVLPALILTVLLFGVWDCLAGRMVVPVRWLLGSVAALVVAVACRGLDLVWPLSSPEVWLKGHALWHCFAAASLGCMYVYFRAERRVA